MSSNTFPLASSRSMDRRTYSLREKKIRTTYAIERLEGWRKTGCAVVLWYDSAFLSTVGKRDLAEMEQYFKDKIQIRDVRNLKIVRNYPHQFTEDVDIYFRCDLLRIACSIEDLETEQDPFTISIYTDWSLKLRRKRLAAFLGLFNG